MKRFKKGTPEYESRKEQLKAEKNYKKLIGRENLIITKTAIVTLPKKMLYINDEGDQKIINTLTKKGNLTSRDKQPIVKLLTHDKNFVSSTGGKTLLDRTFIIKKGIRDKKTDNFSLYYATIGKINDIRNAIKKLKNIEKPNKNHKSKLIQLNKELDIAIEDNKRKEKIYNMYKNEINKDN